MHLPNIKAPTLAAAVAPSLVDAVTESVRGVLVPVINELRESLPQRDATFAEYLSATEAAGIAAVTAETVREWVRTGKLRGHHAGRLLRIARTELVAFLASGVRSAPRHAVDVAAEILERRMGPNALVK